MFFAMGGWYLKCRWYRVLLGVKSSVNTTARFVCDSRLRQLTAPLMRH